MEDNEINLVLKKYVEVVSSKHQLVTVFVLTHKRPFYLKLAIKSILNQDYTNFCLIVLDNMSEDETKKTVESFCDSRVFYIERDGSKGVSNSTFGFQNCKTKYAVVFHDDDLVDKHYLEKMLSVMENNNDFTILSCRFDLIDADGNKTMDVVPTGNIYTFNKGNYLKDYVERRLPFLALFPCVMYRMEFFEDRDKYADLNAGPCVDEYMYFQIERYGGTIALFDELLFHYRKYLNQDSSLNSGWMGLKLFNYILSQDYYMMLLKNDMKTLSWIIDYSFGQSLNGYLHKRIDKSRLKYTYRLIPHPLKKANKNKVLKYWVFVHFPKLICSIYKKRHKHK